MQSSEHVSTLMDHCLGVQVTFVDEYLCRYARLRAGAALDVRLPASGLEGFLAAAAQGGCDRVEPSPHEHSPNIFLQLAKSMSSQLARR